MNETRSVARLQTRRAKLILLAVIMASLIGYHYRRELYVWAMLDCAAAPLFGGKQMRESLLLHDRLMTEKLDRADSDADRIAILRRLLAHRYPWKRTCAIRYLTHQPQPIRVALSPDLVTVIETPVDSEASPAIDLMKQIHPLPEEVVERLTVLALSPDQQSWKRTGALWALYEDRREAPQFADLVNKLNQDLDWLVQSTAVECEKVLKKHQHAGTSDSQTRLDVSFPSRDGYRIQVNTIITLRDVDVRKQAVQDLLVDIEREIRLLGCERDLLQMTGKDHHSTFLDTLRNEAILSAAKKSEIIVAECRLQLVVLQLDDESRMQLREVVAKDVLLE